MPPIIPPTGLGAFLVENIAAGAKDAWMMGFSCDMQALASLLVEIVNACAA